MKEFFDGFEKKAAKAFSFAQSIKNLNQKAKNYAFTKAKKARIPMAVVGAGGAVLGGAVLTEKVLAAPKQVNEW